MISYNKLISELFSRVGIRQTIFSNEIPKLSGDVVESESGLLVNSVNEQFLTNSVLFDGLQFTAGIDVDDWEAGDFEADQVVRHIDQEWICLGTTTDEPGYDSEDWETLLSNQIRKYKQSAASELINDFLTEQSKNFRAKRLLKSSPVFQESTQSKRQKTAKEFVGYMINPGGRSTIQLHLNQLGFKSSEAKTFDLYLYHSSQEEALIVKEITLSGNGKFEWIQYLDGADPVVLNSISDLYNEGGSFFIGYYEETSNEESDLYSWRFPTYWTGAKTCSSCGSYDVNGSLFKAARPYYQMQSIRIAESSFNETDPTLLPNLGEMYNNVHSSNLARFNMRFSAYCDPTPLISESIYLFDKAYQTKIAVLILTDLMNSNRINNTSDNAARKIELQLMGAFTNGIEVHKGILSQYKDEVSQIELDFSGVDPVCFPQSKNYFTLGAN